MKENMVRIRKRGYEERMARIGKLGNEGKEGKDRKARQSRKIWRG